MAKIRLNGAQVTRITEAINRCANLKDENSYSWGHPLRLVRPLIPEHMLIEDLVEDILKIVLPSEEYEYGEFRP